MYRQKDAMNQGGVAGRPQKSQVDTGVCKPQSDVLYTKLDMPRPHLFEAQFFQAFWWFLTFHKFGPGIIWADLGINASNYSDLKGGGWLSTGIQPTNPLS